MFEKAEKIPVINHEEECVMSEVNYAETAALLCCVTFPCCIRLHLQPHHTIWKPYKILHKHFFFIVLIF